MSKSWSDKIKRLFEGKTKTPVEHFLEECAKNPSNAHIYRVNPPIPQPGSIVWYLQQEEGIKMDDPEDPLNTYQKMQREEWEEYFGIDPAKPNTQSVCIQHLQQGE